MVERSRLGNIMLIYMPRQSVVHGMRSSTNRAWHQVQSNKGKVENGSTSNDKQSR